METQIEITSKDCKFYLPFFKRHLSNDKNTLERWIELSQNRMDELQKEDPIYLQQEQQLQRYQQSLQIMDEKIARPLDETNELFMTYIQKQLQMKQKQVVNSKKKKDQTIAKKNQITSFEKKFRQDEYTIRKTQYRLQKDMNSNYDRIIRIDNEMPDYMKKALQNMTSNKGYIYRGVWFFGHIPHPDNDTLTMFERIKGILYIHEYIFDPYSNTKIHNVYEKLSKNSPKTLLSSNTKKK
jgi:hypothetical protein